MAFIDLHAMQTCEEDEGDVEVKRWEIFQAKKIFIDNATLWNLNEKSCKHFLSKMSCILYAFLWYYSINVICVCASRSHDIWNGSCSSLKFTELITLFIVGIKNTHTERNKEIVIQVKFTWAHLHYYDNINAIIAWCCVVQVTRELQIRAMLLLKCSHVHLFR